MKGKHLGKVLSVLVVASSSAFAAIPYKDQSYFFTQPNGEKVEIVLNGNTYVATQTTTSGFPVIYDEKLQGMAYAKLSENGETYISSGVLVANKTLQNKRLEATFGERKSLSREAVIEQLSKARTEFLGTSSERSAPLAIDGNVKGLTIIIDFPDLRGTISKSQVESFLNDLNYAEFGNAQSVRGYFREVSGGKLDYTNTVTAYYTAKKNKAYYADSSLSSTVRSQELISEALAWLENTQGFDFSTLTVDSSKRIRGLNVFYAGASDSSWSKGLWPHMAQLSPRFCADEVCTDRYQITDMGNSLAIGTFVHESGHLITNWPDLYDYDGSSEGSVASFGVMGFGAIGATNRFKPTPPVAPLRDKAGWDTVTELNPSINRNAPLGQVSHTSGTNTSYKWTNENNANEAFYIEAIHKSGQNSEQLDQGLAIWHVDPTGSNSDEWHPYIQMEHADGNRDPENNRNRGDSTDLFDVAGEFSDTLPNALSSKGTNAKWWSGKNSGMLIDKISDPKPTMTFNVDLVGALPIEEYRGYLDNKGQAIEPNGNWFQYAGGSISLNLEGPTGADFDLKIEKWVNSAWQQVAVSESPTSSESINYTAASGYYRVIVYSYSGAGNYLLYMTR